MGSLTISTGFDLAGAEHGYRRLGQLTRDAARTTVQTYETSNTAIKEQTRLVEKLALEYEKALSARSSNAVALGRQLETAEAHLNSMVGASQQMGNVYPVAISDSEKATQNFGRTVGKLFTRLKRVFATVVFFNLVRKSFLSLRNYIGTALKDNQQFATSFAQIKGNLSTAFQPLLQTVIPIIAQFTDWLAKGTQYLVMFISALTGRSIKSMQDAAKNMDKLAANTKKTGKEAQKIVAPFDEINQISQSTADASAAMEDTAIAPEYAATDELTTQMQETLQRIGLIVGAATLVIGAILAFTGVNVGLGIGMMVAGAALVWATIEPVWNSLDKEMQDTITSIGLIVSGASLVIGAILAFTGINIPLGIALIAAGAIGLAVIASQSDEMKNQVEQTIIAIAGIVGIAFLVIGAILAFSGANIPLGIALIAAGALGLIAEIAQSSKLSEGIKGEIVLIMAAVSAALLVLGAILALTGANIPLGIAFIAIGAVGLAAAIAQTSELSDDVKTVIAIITLAVSTALLAIGAVLAFTGANVPLGIGMIAVGAIGLVAAIMQTSALTDEVKQTIGLIAAIAGAALIALGIILICFGIIPLGMALLAAGAISLVSAIAANWDGIVGFVKDITSKVGKFFSDMWDGIKKGAALVWWGIQVGVLSMVNFVIDVINLMVKGILAPFNLIIAGLNLIPGVNIPSLSWSIDKIPLPPIPALATGTVVPPNKQFMAILGDNTQEPEVVSPLSTIEQAVENALDRRGGIGGDLVIPLVLDGREVGRAVLPWTEVEKTRRGGSFSTRMATT